MATTKAKLKVSLDCGHWVILEHQEYPDSIQFDVPERCPRCFNYVTLHEVEDAYMEGDE